MPFHDFLAPVTLTNGCTERRTQGPRSRPRSAPCACSVRRELSRGPPPPARVSPSPRGASSSGRPRVLGLAGLLLQRVHSPFLAWTGHHLPRGLRLNPEVPGDQAQGADSAPETQQGADSDSA